MLSKKTHEKMLLPLLVIVAFISVSITAYLVDKNLKKSLVIRANTIASLLETIPTENLAGDESDLNSYDYLLLKQKLTEIRKVNTDSRFIYIIKETPQGVIFLVDSEPSDSPDYSPPGQIYEEISPTFYNALINGLSGWEISHDRWGSWITGYGPLHNPRTGEYVALVGVDLDYYSNYLYPIIGYSSIPFFIFVILFLIIFNWRRLQQIENHIIHEKEQLIRIAHHEFGTPIAESGAACESLLKNKAVQKNAEALFFTQHMYASLMTLVRRTTNLLKTIELTVPQDARKIAFDVIPLIAHAVEIHTKVAEANEKKIKIVQPFPKIVRVFGNTESIEIVFANLIAHSLYYTEKKGTAEIYYKELTDYHQFTTFSPGDSLSQDEVYSLFSAYYKGEKLSSHTQSTGLGLYLIHKIVTQHHGTVEANSTEKGVAISVNLPKI